MIRVSAPATTYYVIYLQDTTHSLCSQMNGAHWNQQWLHNILLKDVCNGTLDNQTIKNNILQD